MLSNKKLNPVVTELFITGKKLNITLVFITQYYFVIPKNTRINSTHFFVMNIPTNRSFNKLQSVIHQIMIFKTLGIITINLPKIHI